MPPKKTTRVEVKAMLSDGTVVPIHELENLDVTEAEEILAHYEFVKVVRCKDCANYEGHGHYCDYDILAVEDGFCYFGERREK